MKLQDLIADWIANNEIISRQVDGISACNFGLFESPKGYTIYLTGSKEYDSEDDDWALDVDYEPQYKYLIIPIEFTQRHDWLGVLEIVRTSLTEYLNSEAFSISGLSTIEVITTGFDDGELVRIK